MSKAILRRLAINGYSGTACPTEKIVGDVYPVVFHDATVEPVSANTLEQAALARRRDFSKWEAKTVSRGLTKAECEALPASYGTIKECPYNGDYWAAAVKECGGVDNLASEEDIFALVQNISSSTCNSNHKSCWGLVIVQLAGQVLPDKKEFPCSPCSLWSLGNEMTD